ncbi:MAG: methyltransferase [Rikenellaceae bacterium]|nr:methyltransferase [Rikenellaceae bacterium]
MFMEWNLVLRLCVAGLCGALIGLDREYRVKDAGFRTHFLVALGSALMMVVSQYGFADSLQQTGMGVDPSRIAAQVVSGIGFIGAGTIIIHRQLVRGLTTAASLWATAGIGLAAGAHLYLLAGIATLLTLFGLEALSLFFGRLGQRRLVLVLSSESRKALDRVLTNLPTDDFSLLSYEIETLHEPQNLIFRATMVLRSRKATATDHYVTTLRTDPEIMIEQMF